MNLYSKVVKEVEALPDGPHIGAFFDFDGTIIYGYSATTYLREQVKRGDVTPRQLLDVSKTMVEFGLGNMGFSAMMMAVSQFLAGIEESDYQKFAVELYKKHIAKLIYPESRALIEAHLKKGHTVAIVSAATPYQVVPAAKELGIKHVKCSNLEVVDGRFTGAVEKPTCYGMGKVDAAEQLVEEYGLDIQQSLFYSDSDEDIQLLEYVGKPRPLNPNKNLRRIARGRGWPVQDFNSRGNASIGDYVRTVGAQVSMLTSVLAGIPIYALTGSLNKSRNFSASLFADTACALTGIELDVTGEEHAWGHRPCVFVFNHQSQADVIILPTLLRRDLAGVGKKEIGDVPILGRLMKIAGTVLIDRNNSRSARESMKPLVDVMLKEGRSVCIAPEGTRSTSTHLGRFKKGAFHLAMQAGVPIVPIVIHNAIDVAPRGQFVLRPATVKVTVLPAVETKNWKVSTMNQHVHEVRDMFLEELDQMQFQPSSEELSRLERVAKLHAIKEAKREVNKAEVEARRKAVPENKVLSPNAMPLKPKSSTEKIKKISARKTSSVKSKAEANSKAKTLQSSPLSRDTPVIKKIRKSRGAAKSSATNKASIVKPTDTPPRATRRKTKRTGAIKKVSAKELTPNASKGVS